MLSRAEGTVPARCCGVSSLFLWSIGLVSIAVGGYVLARSAGDDGKSTAAATEEKTDAGRGDARTAPVAPANPFPRRVKAPSFDGGKEWLNTAGEITLKDVRGKIVLLDFWTYCCINCMHVLPDLKYLEKKYPNEVVVIGVHSAKFDNEKDSANIRRAIQRYEIEHPVINDADMLVWRKFGARAWPTLVLLDPEGYYCGYISGEGNRELLDNVVQKLIDYHKAKGTLDRTPVHFALESRKLKPTPLKFPGKVLADEKSNRVFISDSNHNRIVVASLDGKLLDVIGSGAIGRKDGGYDKAQFDHPQGMELVGQTLYVADTENHLIRKIDLEKKAVGTLAGTGEQAHRRFFSGKIDKMPLNSPWALKHLDGVLYICMAGPHQIFSHKLGDDTLRVYAGSGREDITNGSLDDSAFAQPSSIDTDGEQLFVADSEGSAIRRIVLKAPGKVMTVVGASDLFGGRSLFEFGDVDDVGSKARLQHPLAVAHHKGTLYVADSYNHKIKRVDLKTNRSTAWLGDGKRGASLDPIRFSEPSGLSIAAGKLFIADCNNHRILTADLKTGKVVEFAVADLEPPKVQRSNGDRQFAGSKPVEVKPQTVKSGEAIHVDVKVTLPDGYKLNKAFPTTYRVKAAGEQTLIAVEHLTGRHTARIADGAIEFSLPTAGKPGKATLELTLTFGYCRGGKGGLCKLHTARWNIPIAAGEAGAEKIDLAVAVVEKLKPAKKPLEGVPK